MENTKKQRFCLGALFLIIPALLDLWVYLSYFSLNVNQILAMLITGLTVGVTILLLMKKQNLFSVISAGLIGCYHLYKIIWRLFLYDPTRLFHIFPSEIPDFLSSLLLSISWFLLALMLLSNNGILPAINGKRNIFCKIFYPTTIIVIIIVIPLYFVWGSVTISGIYYAPSHLLSIYYLSGILELLRNVGLLLIGHWIVNPYAKEKKEPVTDSHAANPFDSSSEDYISLGKHICLLIFTCGIWQMIWVYRTTRYTNQAKGEEFRIPTNKLLLYIFVPFYSIYWTYKTALRIDKMAQEKNMTSDLGTVCLILSIFISIVPPIFMQEKINQIVSNPTQPVSTTISSNLESLEKLKDLLDKGIITQEEFDAKKKQLLGL